MENTIEQAAPGIWLVTFASPGMMAEAHCGHLVTPLVEASKLAPFEIAMRVQSKPVKTATCATLDELLSWAQSV